MIHYPVLCGHLGGWDNSDEPPTKARILQRIIKRWQGEIVHTEIYFPYSSPWYVERPDLLSDVDALNLICDKQGIYKYGGMCYSARGFDNRTDWKYIKFTHPERWRLYELTPDMLPAFAYTLRVIRRTRGLKYDYLGAVGWRLEGKALERLNKVSYLPPRYPESFEYNVHERRENAIDMPYMCISG